MKTTGGKGLHVVAPIERRVDQEELRAAVTRLTDIVVERRPDLVTDAFRKAKRGGRVMLDPSRNGTGATIVALVLPARAADATVSFPVAPEELGSVSPADFTVRTVPTLLGRPGPKRWRALVNEQGRLPSELLGRTLKNDATKRDSPDELPRRPPVPTPSCPPMSRSRDPPSSLQHSPSPSPPPPPLPPRSPARRGPVRQGSAVASLLVDAAELLTFARRFFAAIRRSTARLLGFVGQRARGGGASARPSGLQSFLGCFAVAELGSFLLRGDREDAVDETAGQALEDPRALHRPQRRRRRDVEAELDPRVRRVDRLAAGSGGPAEPPAELVLRNRDGSRDTERTGHRPLSLPLSRYPAATRSASRIRRNMLRPATFARSSSV